MLKPALMLAAFAAMATPWQPVAAADKSVEIGQLTCRQIDRTNLVLFSSATFSCSFDPISGENEAYIGAVSKVGVDLTDDRIETIVWYVFAPSATKAVGALAGDYYGVSADASLGAGIGGKVLVGGLDESIALQPAAVSGTQGVGLAAGIEQFKLKFR